MIRKLEERKYKDKSRMLKDATLHSPNANGNENREMEVAVKKMRKTPHTNQPYRLVL
jgi:hypothetical protein